MKTKTVTAHKHRLDGAFKLVESLPTTNDMELRSHLAKYLCVLTSGFVEASVRAVLMEHARTRASKEVRNYVEVRLKDFRLLRKICG